MGRTMVGGKSSLLVSCLCAGLLVHQAVWAEDSVPAGVFETAGAVSTLTVVAGAQGKRKFDIETIGANGHMCSLSGKIAGLKGRADSQPGDAECLIDFKLSKGSVSVSTKTSEACRSFCGMRAWFEGDYLLPPAGCASREREARKKTFLARYKSHDYAKALDAVNGLYTQCKEFLNWIEIDSVRNDIAVTQLHLGNKDACRDVLKDALGVLNPNKDALRESLPPTDYESYLPVAQATWFNLKQCGGQK